MADQGMQPVYPTSAKPLFNRIAFLLIGLAALALISWLFGSTYEDEDDLSVAPKSVQDSAPRRK
ncbi:MAG: hypothetical protein IT292_09690 [Deltaproteobacteria bacterium]|nr:hypothetical protein [Deltaproteobacteria bacterium]